jgi:hypothetical protein
MEWKWRFQQQKENHSARAELQKCGESGIALGQSRGTLFLNGCLMLISQSMMSFQNSALHVHVRRRAFSGPQNSKFCEHVIFLMQKPVGITASRFENS